MRLSVPAHPKSLPTLRGAVTEALERSRWPRERVGDVLLAVSEAVGNAIEHGSRPGEAVEVDITVTPEDARVRVADHGRPGTRPPDGDPLPPPPDRPRGRGRLIMEALAESWKPPRPEGTEVRLRFLSRSPAGGVASRWDIARPADASPARTPEPTRGRCWRSRCTGRDTGISPAGGFAPPS